MTQQIPEQLAPVYLENEQIFWQRILTKGFFRKKITEVQVITNRAIRLNKQALDLREVDTIVLINKHTRRQGTHQTYSVGMGRGSGLRVYTGTSKGVSVSYADLCFFHNGRLLFTMQQVEDAAGIKGLICACNPQIR